MSDLLDKAPAAKQLTASDIRAALKLAYKAPEAVVGFEVSNATGANARRHVDAVVMDLWPSRGLALTAVEIKISRGDFQRELKQPEKSEAIAKYCDFFVIAAPKGLIRADELPLAWGLWEVDAAGALKIKVRPQRTEAQPVDRHFLAAMVRAFSYADAAMVDAIVAQRRQVLEREYADKTEGFHRRVREEVDRRSNASEGKQWAEFCKSLGENQYSLTEKDAIALFKVMRAVGFERTYNGMKEWLDTMERTLTRGREIMSTLTPAEGAAAAGQPDRDLKISGP
jgi:hypothetical protein